VRECQTKIIDDKNHTIMEIKEEAEEREILSFCYPYYSLDVTCWQKKNKDREEEGEIITITKG